MTSHRPTGVDVKRLLALVRGGDFDAAIDGGLMACRPEDVDGTLDRALLATTQARLRDAWAARERYRDRNARLARRDAERNARRAAVTTTQATPSSLPPEAAAALARAKAKAARKP